MAPYVMDLRHGALRDGFRTPAGYVMDFEHYERFQRRFEAISAVESKSDFCF